jgi:hypothetical protein
MAFDRFCFMVPLANPSAVVLSTCIGVGGCGWPSSVRVLMMGTASCPFKYPAPISASAAEPTTTSMILHMVCTGPFKAGRLAGALRDLLLEVRELREN